MLTSQRKTTTLDAMLAALYSPIADDLASAEEVLREELRSRLPFVDALTEQVRLYQGKRLRPALLLLVAKALGRVRREHHTLAAVVEMIHAATLVHDDVLDDAEVRRHVATVNAEWGNEASVLLGDYLFTHAFHLAASCESTHACRRIGRSTNLVCEGELHQVSRRGSFDLAEAEYFSIIEGKTAELVACSCALGAHYAEAGREVEQAMDTYGRKLGVAFQIADDLLDLLSESRQTGKTSGADLAKQKLTLPLIRFRDTADAQQVARCRAAFENPGAEQRETILELLSGSDAIAYTENTARQYASDAARCLKVLPDGPARDVLHAITRFVVDRTR